MSRRQSIVALSTAEAEYVAACEAAMEAVATSNILQEVLPQRSVKLKLGLTTRLPMFWPPTLPTVVAPDTSNFDGTLCVNKWRRALSIYKVKGAENPADAFTKPLDKLRLKDLLWLVGVSGAI
ncbi:hypothetical protein PF003_g23222 [Phytophthora fragariae]|nr:hypothetical protein PF003_g23222 [Phytophthora fragariae]